MYNFNSIVLDEITGSSVIRISSSFSDCNLGLIRIPTFRCSDSLLLGLSMVRGCERSKSDALLILSVLIS